MIDGQEQFLCPILFAEIKQCFSIVAFALASEHLALVNCYSYTSAAARRVGWTADPSIFFALPERARDTIPHHILPYPIEKAIASSI